jgi:hypothetical protein
MKNLIRKLNEARMIIATTDKKKEGKNTFSNYNYFTPDQVKSLVDVACSKVGILPIFELKRNEIGVYGTITLYDMESEETMTTQMASAIPDIKATNIAQQLGGAMTYTERYMKMALFGITDNNLDFDAQDNREKTPDYAKMINNCKTQEELISVWTSIPHAVAKTLTTLKDKKKGELSCLK